MDLIKALTISLFAVTLPLQALEMQVTVEIPKQKGEGKYHPPFVAGWLENKDKVLTNQLFVWYQDALENDEGEEWLSELDTWWKKGGREADLPIDGVSGATRTIGKYTLKFDLNSDVIKSLTESNYTMYVEAAREGGDIELISIPLEIPTNTTFEATTKGKHELGAVSVVITP